MLAPAGAQAAAAITTTSAQAAAAASAAAGEVAKGLPELAQGFVEGTLKPAAAEAAEKLPEVVEAVGGDLVEQEGG